MSTRSYIAVQDPENGTFQAIYCHFDGYPDHNGQILFDHYQDPAKIARLFALGDISALGPEIGLKQNFTHPTDTSWCVSYSRDRDEERGENEVFANLKDLVSAFREDAMLEFLYVYYNGKWMFSDSTGRLKTFPADKCGVSENGCCGDCG